MYDTETTSFFNAGKWEVRKGHDVLVEAFNAAFGQNDNVSLTLMPHNPFLTENETREWVNLYKNSKLGNKITILPAAKTHTQVARVMQYMDCGVFPSRAEGWNLEALEMMACGKHIIITDYSGHTEFCNGINSLLIKIDSLEDAYDGKWFHGDGQWASFEENQMKELINNMRFIHEEKQAGRLDVFNKAGIQTAQQFTWENTLKCLNLS